jgi:hypothetical protein
MPQHLRGELPVHDEENTVALGCAVVVLPLHPLDAGAHDYIWKMIPLVNLNDEKGVKDQNDNWYIRDYCKNTTLLLWMCKKRQ